MQNDQTPVIKDLVLVGGGHSHVTVLKRFGMKPLSGVRLTLICRDAHTPYSGMLPGFIAGHYGFDDAHIDLEPLARFAGARFYNDDVTGLDPTGRLVLCEGRPPVPYDLVSINIGSTPATAETPGAEQHPVPVKPINRFVAHWERLREGIRARLELTRIGVVGGGAGGVELILALRYRITTMLADQGRDSGHLEFHLITEEDDILTTHNRFVRAKFRRILVERGVHLHTALHVEKVTSGRVHGAAEAVELDEILWVTRAGAAPWIKGAGLEVDGAGFMRVTDTLQSVSHREVFGAGDIATMINHPRPKSGVFAVRQGPPLAHNLRRALLGRRPRPFTPQKKFLSLIGTGDKYAVAGRSFWSFEGRAMWAWKDWIDVRFMKKFNHLPEMDDHEKTRLPRGLAGADVIKEISAIAMRCGGCGAKVGATVLARALNQLHPVPRSDILIGLHEPDDAAVVEVPTGKVMVHTVDSFRAIIDDPYVFGQISANHSLGDIFAMGGEPQSALAIATVPFGLEDKVEDTLTQMMAGAMAVFARTNTALVGGHTSEGAELSLGFAINGLIDRDRILRKGGMLPGDRLVLTKAVGTGTLFAADMRQKAKGRWITGALASMLQSNMDGAQCLLGHGATACTDVTGFGLLGHLVEMVRPSEVDITLDLAAIPYLDGALETVKDGIVSSLQPQNVRLRRAIANLAEAADDPRYPLIFDPQTAGGLLASVPEDAVEACVAELKDLGYARTAIIGTVSEQGNRLEPVTLIL